MTPAEKDDEKAKRVLNMLAQLIDKALPYHWGFVVLAFPFGEGGRMNYVSNARRPDVVRSMYEFIEATKQQFGEHVAEGTEAQDDSELARLRQRVAELEGRLR
jgi:hypothetical protein